MADSKITALTSISTSTDPANDPLVIVDVSDTSMAATGTTKKVTLNQLLGASGTATLASATISGDLTVDTSTLKVDSANNRVGIGTASPSNSIHLNGASGDTLFRISDSTNGVLGFIGSASGVMTGAPANSLAIRAENGLRFSGQGNAIDMTLSGGNLGLGVTPVAGGGVLQLKSGITFPATQVTSSDANTLDDYEEGTFTATLKGTVSDPTTPVTTTARYTKIGRVVTVTIQFSSVTTTGASGRIQIDGLPFTNNSSLAGTGSVGFNGMATFTGIPFASLSASSSTIAMFASNSSGAYTAVTFNAGTTQDLWTSLTYTV